MKTLIESGLNVRLNNGTALLEEAVRHGFLSIALLLIEKSGLQRSSALVLAAEHGFVELVTVLTEADQAGVFGDSGEGNFYFSA